VDRETAQQVGPLHRGRIRFVESLRTSSAFDWILSDGAFRVLPLRTRAIVITAGATGAIAEEGAFRKISRLQLSSAALEQKRCYAVVAVSHELARASGGAALAQISRELRNALGTVTDGEFIAGLTAGGSVFTIPSSGSDADHIILADLLANIATGAASRLYISAHGKAPAARFLRPTTIDPPA
jgi:hypothetical protein